MPMNKFIISTIYILIFAGATAQKVTVTAHKESVSGDNIEGYVTELDGKAGDVQSSWIRFLKEIGKVRQSGDPITISEPVFNGLVFSKGIIYAVTKNNGEKVTVWLGIKSAEWESNDVSRINNELEKAVYRYGVKFYRDKIQVQIDEAQQASDAVDKQKQRFSNQGKDLSNKLVNNGQEKIQLEKSLEANKLENAVLLVKISNNKKAQDSLARAGEQIQKVKGMHQERQRLVN
jgi:hypothetical protein